jgi:glycogen operon protein
MVARFHESGIEVILDVVYNHTAEGNELGPTLSFKGIDNASYYRLLPDQPRYFINDTGTGNTLNLSHQRVLQMVTDSLRYWVHEMHVDGFRFDLGTILAREPYGFDEGGGFLDSCRQDPVLSSVKLITEPWDCGPGGYQVGGFPPGWAEWNDRYRDTVRAYWKGDEGAVGELATRIAASGDLFNRRGRKPWASVNFITAHDGFTLNDLVSYNDKHNEANGEDNRDGHSDNRSWNHGVEGPTDDPEVLRMRARTQRNLIATLLLSQGVPMLLHGDEGGRTQQGNNNTYCQDNELSWMHWDQLDKPLVEFTAHVARLRAEHPTFRRKRFFTGSSRPEDRLDDIVWLHPEGRPMSDDDWETGDCALGMYLNGQGIAGLDERGGRITDDHFLLYVNACPDDLTVVLPPEEYAGRWTAVVDTAGSADPSTPLAAGE